FRMVRRVTGGALSSRFQRTARSRARRSQNVRGKLREVAPFTLCEHDVRRELLTAEAFGGDREAVRCAVDVGVVDLARIAGEHDLRRVARSRDDRFHLVRSQVLSLIHDDELLRKRTSADVGERLDLDLTALEELGICARALARAGGKEELE